ncbi:hypothetical protein V6260_14600 [Pseudoalteromonas aliena]|uniref:hypothetical protein n=1 Tax=Pseudoalteromonas aliena TaxID=247523 RepID=UPI00311DAF24
MTSKYFNPNESFLNLKILRLTIYLHFIVALTILIIISFNTELRLDLSSNGFNNLISMFRFPLSILALIIPVVALLAANHRSEQTKEQIRLSNLQNIFQNYYKHLEEFTKYSELLEARLVLPIRGIHMKIFPNAPEGNFSLDVEYIGEFVSGLLDILNELMKGYDIKSCKEDLSLCNVQKNKLRDLCLSIGMSNESIKKFDKLANDNVQKKHGNIVANFCIKTVPTVELVSQLSKEINQLARFDAKYIPSLIIQNLSTFDINKYNQDLDNPNVALLADIKRLAKTET